MAFKQGNPITIGLSGRAGTGKTVTARGLVPEGTVLITENYWWDHKYLAMPLYSMANTRRDTEGIKADERIKYELHNVLFDLFGKSPLYGLPDYDVLVDLVYEIYSMPIDVNKEKKPRSFLQNTATLCRELDPDCFIKWMIRSIKRDGAWADENEKQYVCVVSDIRMPNEAQGISSLPNGIVIKLTASEDVIEDRLMGRDGALMTPEQSSHESERVDDIPGEFIDYTLNTDGLTIKEQAKAVLAISSKLLGVELQEQKPSGDNVQHASA